MMRKYMIQEVAVVLQLTEGVRRTGQGIEVQVERGACPLVQTGDRWPQVSLPNLPRSHW